MRTFLRLAIFASLLWSLRSANGDTFTVTIQGVTSVIDARLIGERDGYMALERRDGRIEIASQQQVVKREIHPDPEPISCKTMIERLSEQFGPDKFLASTKAPFIVGLVLSEPLPKEFKRNADRCLEKGVAFMKKVEKGFLQFTKDLKIETEDSRYPLVVLVFETDDDFARFHKEETGGHGLPAESIQGYYNRLTNRLVIRMSECYTFTTPLHEAVHQQVYNRGILPRLAPIPVWFDEGIATGFEGDGNGDRIKNGPKNINKRYARHAMQATTVNWDHVVADDKAFRGEDLAGEAYANAWSIHWFLVTKYRKQYLEFLQVLQQKQPLDVDDPKMRTQDFERAFGKPIGQLQQEFPAWLDQKAREMEIRIADREQVPDGYLILQTNLAQIEMTVLKNGAALEAEGQMRNISQIRPMTFHITMETNGGMYADWYLPNIASMSVMSLPKQVPKKLMKDSPGRAGDRFWIKVKSVLPDSESARDWQRGQLPVPAWRG